MADNKFHIKDWDSKTPEQQAELNEILEQHSQYERKQFEKEQAERLEQVKKETEAELTAKQQAQLERENALKEVPEKNRGFVNKLLDKGFTLDEIKQEQPNLLEKEPDIIPGDLITDQINGKHDETHTAPSGDVNAERDAEIRRFQEQGVDPKDKEANKRWAEYHKQGLI